MQLLPVKDRKKPLGAGNCVSCALKGLCFLPHTFCSLAKDANIFFVPQEGKSTVTS